MAQEYGKRVWAGDPKTVAEARARYQIDPEGQLIDFAVALYSFRTNKRFADELIGLRAQLIMYAKKFLHVSQGDDTYQERANKADILSTHFEWVSHEPSIPEKEREELHEWAADVCERGIRFANLSHGDTKDNHTWCLLELTFARLLINKGDCLAATYRLDRVGEDAPFIKDVNQRARVYRKLGILYRKGSNFASGFFWGIRACTVPGVPVAVRIKSAAALFGIDR